MYGCVTFEWRQVAGGWTTLGGDAVVARAMSYSHGQGDTA